ncbi:hypothetical protein TIFTF001_031200 [Ficus carica]|uniref:Uncharacterized protein n=1 Tax=Ficus carica TaxID=3494 RepID=A0AA88J608_FICCA|nr:hypothetical protein TIFTF001_031200 [Ficus carica]
MATKSCDGTAHHSSIALLQERFRQLQRAKEMRKEKELLRLFSESERTTSNPATKRYEPTGLFFFPESIPPQRPPSHQGSIYLQQNFQANKHGNFPSNETSPIFANMASPTGGAAMNRSYNFDDSDVDTSLHL